MVLTSDNDPYGLNELYEPYRQVRQGAMTYIGQAVAKNFQGRVYLRQWPWVKLAGGLNGRVWNALRAYKREGYTLTTLVAIQGNGWSVIGCDSRASDEDGRFMELATSKVIDNNGVLIAVSGASRGGNITQFGWKPPKPRAVEELDVFMTKKFIPSMRKAFQEAGYEGKEDGDSAFQDSNLIVSVRGTLYPIFNDYSWDREARNVYYAGSGGDIALGALEALDYSKAKTPAAAEKILRRAIEAACKHDIYSGGEIHTFVQEA